MAKFNVHLGSTSVTLNVFIQDSSSSIGAGLNGLTNATSGLKAYYARQRTGSTSIGFASLGSASAGWTSGGFIGVDTVNMVGWYRFDVPDAAFASGSPFVDLHLFGATNMAPCPVEVALTAVDYSDSVHFGLTGIPNAAAGASGGLVINGSNTGAITLGNITTGSVSFGNTSIGTLTATGAASFGSTFAVAGTTTLASVNTGAVSTGNVTVGGTLTVTGAVTHSSSTTFTGPITAVNGSNTIAGIFQANVVQTAGVPYFNYDGTISSATSTTAVTLPALDANGNAIADAGQFAYHEMEINGGTGSSQRVLLTTAGSGARQYNVLAGTMPNGADSTSTYVMHDNWRSNDVLIAGVVPGSATIGAISTNLDKTGYSLAVTPPTAAQIATAVWQDTTAGDMSVATSPGQIIFTRLGGAFTAAGSSTFTAGSLSNAPSGTGASAAAIATAVWQDTNSGDFTVNSSPGRIVQVQLGGAFTTVSSSVFTAAALANAGGSSVTIGTGGLDSVAFTSNAITRVQSGLATPTNITAGTITTVSGNVNGNVGGNVGGNVTGSVGSVASVTNIVSGGAITTSGGAVSTVTTVTDLTSTTFGQPSSVPAASVSFKDMLTWMYALSRNKVTQTASRQVLLNNAGSATIGSAVVSDDSVTFTRDLWS